MAKLIIENVLPSHKGVYTAKAIGTLGDAKCFSHLIVKEILPENKPRLEPPFFLQLFADRHNHEGDLVKFECVIDGHPEPKVINLYKLS